jgi:hypothetical protein
VAVRDAILDEAGRRYPGGRILNVRLGMELSPHVRAMSVDVESDKILGELKGLAAFLEFAAEAGRSVVVAL